MTTTLNIIVGSMIIILNLIPIIFKKYDYIKLTAMISFLILFIYLILSNANAL